MVREHYSARMRALCFGVAARGVEPCPGGMVKNRSVPADTILPHVIYENVAGAAAWLTRTFGFSEQYRYGEPGGPVSGVQMCLGNAYIMLKSARPGYASPARLGHRTQSLTVFVDDVDAHYERAKSAAAKIVEEIHETCYGERQYGAEDVEGHRWLFSRHVRDVNPGEWGATLGPVEK
ncbi:MAG: VOC family protein [Bryobacteraceae bacterium]